MHSKFDYLAEKIISQPFAENPFQHLLIKNFLSTEHFEEIIGDKQIHFNPLPNQDALYENLIKEGYEIIKNFPGCIHDWNEYKKNLAQNNHTIKGNPVEGYGLVLRLQKIQNPLIQELITYLNGPTFKKALHEKFNIQEDTSIITGVQKYLTGYEISPHPDWRMKALTYLLNLNQNNDIDSQEVHTHLLKFKPEYEWIAKFWQLNPKVNCCWVPWDYCETVIKTNENNSIVLFKPSDNLPTLHAIKLNYNHLNFQRTQIYGNLIYKNIIPLKDINYSQLNRYKHKKNPLNAVELKLSRFLS